MTSRSLRDQIVNALEWTGPVYTVSAIKPDTLKPLLSDAMDHLDAAREREQAEGKNAQAPVFEDEDDDFDA